MSSVMLAKHPYETIWSHLVTDYTQVKKYKHVSNVYVDYASMAKTQNFQLLLRVLSKMDYQKLTQVEYITYLINYYNIKMIEAVYLKESLDTDFFNDIKHSLLAFDERTLFCLSGDNIYFPNLVAYSSSILFDQLDEQVAINIQKMIRYDKGVDIIYVHHWFDQQLFSAKFKEALIGQVVPTYKPEKLNIHQSNFGVISNTFKK